MNRKINIGVIGLGIGLKHLSNLMKNVNVNQIFVFDKNRVFFKYKTHIHMNI